MSTVYTGGDDELSASDILDNNPPIERMGKSTIPGGISCLCILLQSLLLDSHSLPPTCTCTSGYNCEIGILRLLLFVFLQSQCMLLTSWCWHLS